MSFSGMMSKMPLVGSFFPSDEAEAHKANLAATSRMYNEMRPEYAQAMMNAWGNAQGGYTGLNNWLAAKYGAGAVPQVTIANPLSPRSFQLGSSAPYSRGADAGSIAGGAAAGAGTGAMAGAAAGPYAGYGAVAGGLLGALGGAMKRGSSKLNDPPPFKPHNTYGGK